MVRHLVTLLHDIEPLSNLSCNHVKNLRGIFRLPFVPKMFRLGLTNFPENIER
jgi:hypothetical protein